MQFEKRITDCGTPLYVFEMPHAQSVSAGVLVKTGTVDESWPTEAGLAHAFEHIVFRGNGMFDDSKAVAAFIEETGGHCNAFTGKELTFFFARVPSDALMRMMPWLYHLVSTPHLTESNIHMEMPTVIQEIKQRDDNPASLAHKIFREAVYGSHPLGRDTLGLYESVNSFTRVNFSAYQQRFYHSKNFVFLVVGNVKTDKALEGFNSCIWRKPKLHQIMRTSHRIKRQNIIKIFEKDGVGQTNTVIGTLIGPANSKETRALELFTEMLSGGMSFPLFQEVRDKRSLCYSVTAFIQQGSDKSLFLIYTGTDPDKSKKAVNVIKQVIEDSMKDEALFEAAKTMVKGKIALQYENPDHILGGAAHDVVFCGKPKSPEEVSKEIEEIIFDDVEIACAKYLDVEKFTEVYVAPKGFKL